jgi:ABC-type lipoprotein export system ATPase subunit
MLITLHSVYKHFSDLQLLDDINLELEDNCFVTIIGVSGSGKTTLLNIIDGIEPVSQGTIYRNSNLKSIHYVTQKAHFIDELSIKDNLLFASLKHKSDIYHYCEYFNCRPLLNKKPKELSGGEKQRINIIRSLLMKPQLLILDEPTAALDFDNKIKVAQLLNEIHQKEKIGVILVTHDRDMVEYTHKKKLYELKNKKLIALDN